MSDKEYDLRRITSVNERHELSMALLARVNRLGADIKAVENRKESTFKYRRIVELTERRDTALRLLNFVS